MLQEFFDKLDLRQQLLLASGAFVLLAAAMFSYILLPPIKAYRESTAARTILADVASKGQAVSQQLESLEIEVEALRKQLHGDTANLAAEQLESFVIGRLQTISWRNDVELMSIVPSAGGTVQVFQESVFRVELSGSYRDLVEWLGELNTELGFVVIKEYSMQPIEAVAINPALLVNLSIASYRLEIS
jgi:type II secretory pathway component PulM